MTRVIIQGEALRKVHDASQLYFLSGVPAGKLKHCEIYARESSGIFYRNVRVCPIPGGHPAALTYNMTSATKLTEDRTASDQYSLMHHIAVSYLETDNVELLRHMLMQPKGTFEHHMDLDWVGHVPSATFLEVVGEMMRDRSLSINPTAAAVYRKHATSQIRPDVIELTNVEKKMLERARAFCASIGFNIGYEIVVVESLGAGFLGLAQDNQIYIAHRVFMQGTKAVASTLIEEFVHLKHSLRDCTRELQTYLFDRVVSLGEELRGEPL